MAGNKQRPVLYEVAKLARRSLGQKPKPAEPPATPPAEKAAPAPSRSLRPTPTPPAPPVVEDAPRETPKAAPPVRQPPTPSVPPPRSELDRGLGEDEPSNVVLHLRLTMPMIALGVAGVLLVLWITFQAGRRFEHGGGATAAEPAGGAVAMAPDRPAVRDSGRQEPPMETPPSAAQRSDSPASSDSATADADRGQPERVQLQSGFHYLIVQHFRKRDRQSAEQAAQFFLSKGLRVGLLTGEDILLVVDDPFLIDQDDRASKSREESRAEALRAHVRELGREYHAQTGMYNFANCYLRRIR